MEHIGKLEGGCASEENLAGSSKLDHGAFLRPNSGPTGISVGDAAELNGNSYGGRVGEKTREISDLAGLRRARWCCGLLRQAIPFPYRPGFGLFWRSSRFEPDQSSFWDYSAVGLPLFPVRKSIGEPESAVSGQGSCTTGTTVLNGRISTEALAFSSGYKLTARFQAALALPASHLETPISKFFPE